MEIALIVIGIVIFVIMIALFTNSNKPVLNAVLNMFLGVAILIVGSLVLSFFGISLSINPVTTFISLTLGGVGAIALVILKFIL